MCLGTHQRKLSPIFLGQKAIEASLIDRETSASTIQLAEISNSKASSPLPNHQEFDDEHDLCPSPPLTISNSHEITAACNHHAQRQHHPHIIVQHNYHDHSNDSEQPNQYAQHPAKGGVTIPFPMKLYAMLDNVQREGREDIVSWQPHGRCFVVHKPKEIVELLPRFFKLSKLQSFQRQLNLYGYQRLTRGRDKGAYYHELFLRGKPYLALGIQRMKVKGTGIRARSNPEQEPNFWTMEWMRDDFQGPFLRTDHEGTMDVRSSANPCESVHPGGVSSSSYVSVVTTSLDSGKVAVPKLAIEEDVIAFDKPFHSLDPFQPLSLDEIENHGLRAVPNECGQLSSSDTEIFLDFEFPDLIGREIEKDAVFGELLASLIA